MFCRHCGESIPDDSTFCPRCGADVREEGTAAEAVKAPPAEVPAAAPAVQASVPAPATRQGGLSIAKIIGGVAIGILAAAGIIYLLAQASLSKPKPPESAQTQVDIVEPEPEPTPAPEPEPTPAPAPTDDPNSELYARPWGSNAFRVIWTYPANHIVVDEARGPEQITVENWQSLILDKLDPGSDLYQRVSADPEPLLQEIGWYDAAQKVNEVTTVRVDELGAEFAVTLEGTQMDWDSAAEYERHYYVHINPDTNLVDGVVALD